MSLEIALLNYICYLKDSTNELEVIIDEVAERKTN
jgi:hypothetical protein